MAVGGMIFLVNSFQFVVLRLVIFPSHSTVLRTETIFKILDSFFLTIFASQGRIIVVPLLLCGARPQLQQPHRPGFFVVSILQQNICNSSDNGRRC
jgi:hypothetical protein